MTDSNYSKPELEVDEGYADYLADLAEQATDEYERRDAAQEATQAQLQTEERVVNGNI